MKIMKKGFLHFEASIQSAGLTSLGWDTEGTGREEINLMQSPVTLNLINKNQSISSRTRFDKIDDNSIQYAFSLENDLELLWEIGINDGGLYMYFLGNGNVSEQIDKLELIFPFDPTVAITTIISSHWDADGKFYIPAIINAPDLGQMLMTCPEYPDLIGRVKGNRKESWTVVTLELPIFESHYEMTLNFTPVILPLPTGYKNEQRWKYARRGWFNQLEFSCGASGVGNEVNGVWANNMLSDPVSSLIFLLADATLLVPELAPGVTMPPILRHCLDYWINYKSNAEGQIAYTALGIIGRDEPSPDAGIEDPTFYQNVMDGNPSILIGAWSYIKTSSNIEWLEQTINKLELLSQFMEKRDIDNDGLIESKQSGNTGSRLSYRAPDSAWDCYCSGHKNAYINALSYRAWLCLAELEGKLGRYEMQQKYIKLAKRIKSIFYDTFYNPKTGWLGWWRSRDGELHDIYSDTPTSIAISYGLIDNMKGAIMLEKYWQELTKSGFNRFDLGIPITLRPVPREEMEHYTPFEVFLNGGCCVSNTSFLIDALYKVGMEERGNIIADAMLERQQKGAFPNRGGFQNGFVDNPGYGAEVFDWSGNPSGYEGHLIYCWSFLHAILRKEPTLKEIVHGNMIGSIKG